MNFQIVKSRGRHSEQVLHDTDDWVEALAAYSHEQEELYKDPSYALYTLKIVGVHPTHKFPATRPYNGRCSECGAWDNSSYGSIAPCGYKFTKSLAGTIEDEINKRGD